MLAKYQEIEDRYVSEILQLEQVNKGLIEQINEQETQSE